MREEVYREEMYREEMCREEMCEGIEIHKGWDVQGTREETCEERDT